MTGLRPANVLFDLDGTLLDTAPDLAYALNQVRANHGQPPLPFAAIRPYVSHGSFALTRLGFDLPDDTPEFETRRQDLLSVYHQNLARGTRLFEGMEAVLQDLEARAMRWGIVTNKPGWLTNPLLAQLGLQDRAGCVVSGDTLAERKPHPAPLLHAAAQLGVAAGSCVYVGDAARDVEAGKRAGMRTLVALYGYIGPGEDPAGWHADGSVSTPAEISDWLGACRA